MLQPNKDKAKSYDDAFLDHIAESDSFKQWSTPTNTKLATTNAFDTERHTADINTSNQDNLNEGVNPYLNQFADINASDPFNEIRANNQSWQSKSLSGVGRILTKATSEIAKLPGVVVGSIAAPFAEDGQGFETAFNNPWVKAVNKLNEDVNTELLPVYVKKAVSEGNLWDNISSVDFWATEGADGIGFIASMLAPGAALKSLGLGNKILGTTAKGLSMINGEAKLAGATQALTELGITAEGIDLTATTLANTLFESGSEAGSAMDNFQKDLDEQLKAGTIDTEQYDTLIQQKGKLGRDIFLSNVAILLGPNAIQSKMLWGKAGAKSLVTELTPSIGKKVLNRASNVALATGSEGFFEEGLQSTVETMFSKGAKQNELTDNITDDFNVGELANSYLDMVSSTEGQKAIFLGGILGGGMSAYQGAKSDITNRNSTNNLISFTQGKVNTFNNIYETDPYIRNEQGSIILDDEGKPTYDPVKVKQVAEALEFTERQSQLFDEAVANGDTETVNQFKDQAINQLITPFITQGEMGIDALKQYLEQSRQTEELATDEDSKTLVKDIVDKASYMQKQYESYKDFSNSLIKLDNIGTEDDKTSFYNRLADTYINLKGDEYTQRNKLQELNSTKDNLLKELRNNENVRTEDIVDSNATEDIFKYRYEQDPRIKLINSQINQSKSDLKETDDLVNNLIWDNTEINKAFKNYVNVNNKTREDNSPENITKVTDETTKVNEATTIEELNEVKPTNPVVKQQVQAKKEEFKQQEIALEDTQRQEIINEELGVQINPETQSNFDSLFEEQPVQVQPVVNEAQEVLGLETARKGDKGIYFTNFKGLRQDWEKDKEVTVKAVSKIGVLFEGEKDWKNFNERWHNFRNLTKEAELNKPKVVKTYTNIDSTEGSEVTDELTPTEGINNAVEELNSINTGDVDNGKGVKVISTNKNTGEPLSFIIEQFPNYVAYERTPIDKTGKQVGFEVNLNPGNNINVNKALELFKRNDFNDRKLLFDYLPINVKFTDEVKAPIETRRVNDAIDPSTEILRTEIISRLIQGQPIDNIKGSVQGQYKGLLKVESSTAENNIMDLDGIKDLNYIRQNLYVINAFGQLQNIITGETQLFKNPFTNNMDRSKENAKGEIYLMIPQANGTPFPLKLNIKKINNLEADIIYNIHKEILTNNKSFNTTVGEVNDSLRNNILDNFNSELEIIGGIKEDVKLFDIIDLILYSNTTNIKSQIRIENNSLLFGNQVANLDNIDLQKDNIINFLTNVKRHQVKISPKSETDNTKTNIQSNSADYLKYLVNNKILSTNAVVNEPTFQGYTNIYLNPTVSLESNVKPISNIKDKLSKIKTIDDLTESYNSLSPEQQSLYKQEFSNRKNAIKTGVNANVNISEQGAEIAANNFTGLDFNTTEEIPLSTGIQFLNDNNRNNENNFVSLSEIEGTMENTQVKEVQSEVYEVPTDARDRKQDIDRLASLIKRMQSGKELKANEVSDYNKFKNAYPSEYEKRCK